MAHPKSFLPLGLLFALALLISSQVSARELAKTAQQAESTEKVNGDVHKDGYSYYRHHSGHHYGGYRGRQGYGGYHGGYHGHYPPEKKFTETDGYSSYGPDGHGPYNGSGPSHSGRGHPEPGSPGPHGLGGHGPYRPPKDGKKY